MSQFNIILMVAALAAVGITLSSVAIDKTIVLDGRINDLSIATNQAAATQKSLASPVLFQDPAIADAVMSKAAIAVSLHPFCKANPDKCAEHVESIHRMVKGLSCDLVTKGVFQTLHVDVAISHGNNVICAGPSYSNISQIPTRPKDCEIKLDGVCVYSSGDAFSIHFGKMEEDVRARRSGSLDLNGNWDQNNGASVNGEFKDNWGNSNLDLKGGWSQGQGANVQGSYNYNFDNNRGSVGVTGGWSQNGGAQVGVGFHYNF
jgi:hypothetical protein